jgi:hypothetical protein
MCLPKGVLGTKRSNDHNALFPILLEQELVNFVIGNRAVLQRKWEKVERSIPGIWRRKLARNESMNRDPSPLSSCQNDWLRCSSSVSNWMVFQVKMSDPFEISGREIWTAAGLAQTNFRCPWSLKPYDGTPRERDVRSILPFEWEEAVPEYNAENHGVLHE